MKAYHDLHQNDARKRTSLSQKWKGKFHHPSRLPFYPSTENALIKSVEICDEFVLVIEARCKAIQTVIDDLERQIGRMYPKRGLGKTPKHHRTDKIREAFETAFAPLKKAMDEVEQLRKKEKQAQEALHEAKVLQERLQFDINASRNQSDRAQKKVNDRQIDLDDIQRRLNQARIAVDQAETVYRVQATGLFEQCQELEGERLDLIRQALIQFIDTIKSSENPVQVNTILDQIRLAIEQEQNTLADLEHWADAHGIDLVLSKKLEPRTPSITDMQPVFQ